MTAFLPARAPAPSGGGRSTPRRRRVAGLGVATVVVGVGLVWPVRAEVASRITACPIPDVAPVPEVLGDGWAGARYSVQLRLTGGESAPIHQTLARVARDVRTLVDDLVATVADPES